MKIRYTGGRSRFEVSYDRKPYYFTPENNKITDIQDPKVINYIFGLPNRAEFEVVMEETKPELPKIKEKPIVKPIIKSEKKTGGKYAKRKKSKYHY